MYVGNYKSMSLLTSVSIKEEHKKDYMSMRNWLGQKGMSLGDFLIESYKKSTPKKTLTKI